MSLESNLHKFDAEAADSARRMEELRAKLAASEQTEAEKPIGPDARRRLYREAEQNAQPREADLVRIEDLPAAKEARKSGQSASEAEAQPQPQAAPKGKGLAVMEKTERSPETNN